MLCATGYGPCLQISRVLLVRHDNRNSWSYNKGKCLIPNPTASCCSHCSTSHPVRATAVWAQSLRKHYTSLADDEKYTMYAGHMQDILTKYNLIDYFDGTISMPRRPQKRLTKPRVTSMDKARRRPSGIAESPSLRRAPYRASYPLQERSSRPSTPLVLQPPGSLPRWRASNNTP
jgi:hypothetical protein